MVQRGGKGNGMSIEDLGRAGGDGIAMIWDYLTARFRRGKGYAMMMQGFMEIVHSILSSGWVLLTIPVSWLAGWFTAGFSCDMCGHHHKLHKCGKLRLCRECMDAYEEY